MSPYKRVQKKEKPGPRKVYDDSLGDLINKGTKHPEAVHELLKKRELKQLLNWMVLYPSFEAFILSQKPKEVSESQEES